MESTEEVTTLRPLGAMERMFHQFTRRYPMQFTMAIGLTGPVTIESLSDGLSALQTRHMTLNGSVTDSLDLVPSKAPVPINLSTEGHWEQEAAKQLADRFSLKPGTATARVSLVQEASATVVVLTIAHSLADGLSAAHLLNDLVAVLNGEDLGPEAYGPSRETLLAGVPEVQEVLLQGPPAGPPPVAHEELRIPGTYREFDGRPASVFSAPLSAELTSRLRLRASAEKTTVHGALVTAASHAASRTRSLPFVRVMSPISLSRFIGDQNDLGVYIAVARSGSVPGDDSTFWDEARGHVAEIAPARSTLGVGRSVAAITKAMGGLPTPEESAAFMARGPFGLDVVVSNLGPLEVATDGAVRVASIWGPLVLTQIEGEQMMGAATVHGRLHLVSVGYDMNADFLDSVVNSLTASVE